MSNIHTFAKPVFYQFYIVITALLSLSSGGHLLHASENQTNGEQAAPIPTPRDDFFAWNFGMARTWFSRDVDQPLVDYMSWMTAFDGRPRNDLTIPENERHFMLERLQYEFCPEAIERAVRDLIDNSDDDTFTLPDNYDSKMAQYRQLLPEITEYLKNGDATVLSSFWKENFSDFDSSADSIHRYILNFCQEMIEFQKNVLMRNPILDFDEILVLKREHPNKLGPMPFWRWGAEYGLTVNWSCDFRPKNQPSWDGLNNSLVAISTRTPNQPPRIIFTPPKDRMLQHPELGFDADRILFTMGDDQGAFQLFETDLDGSNLRQITHSTLPDIDNGDGCYLPDGGIIFNSTCSFTGVPCENGESYVSGLCRCDAQGNNMRMLTFDQESNWHPSLLENGRVLYTRFEYANIGHQYGRMLFHMNPDGTNQTEYYGSNSYWPNSMFHARVIPNHSPMVITTVCGHHGPAKTGKLVLLDPSRGRHETDGVVQMIPGYGKEVKREVLDTLYCRQWPKFSYPYPLSEKYFLVSGQMSRDQVDYALYLVDIYDNITEIAKIPGSSLFEPIPIKKRERPPVIPERIDPASQEATVLLMNVYDGPGMKDIPKNSVKKLRIFSYNYQYRDHIKGGYGFLALPGVHGPWEPRYILGEVPIREDGSAYFKIPANLPVAVQPINENGEALQLMRSWFVGMPGENVSCIGCHEDQNSTVPIVDYFFSQRTPDPITPWKGPARGFDFTYEVQPVLDRYCVGCHNVEHPHGLDFTRKSPEEQKKFARDFLSRYYGALSTPYSTSYLNLYPYVRFATSEANVSLQNPLEYHVNTSPLFQLLRKGHHNVTLDDDAWQRLATWIDLGAPDFGSWKNTLWGTPENYYQRRLDSFKQYANRNLDVEWLPEPPDTIPDFIPPVETPTPTETLSAENWPFTPDDAVRRQNDCNLPTSITVEIAPNTSLEFALIPPGKYISQNWNAFEKKSGDTVVTIKQPFYLSKTEITNAQFQTFEPQHRSGFMEWQSFDQDGEGYTLHRPNQPVVRVSWLEADAFCKAVAEKIGRPVLLPDRFQWEWAARCGSDRPFWFGDLDTDFSRFENLAGEELVDLARFQQPVTWLRSTSVCDRQLVSSEVQSFQPNPWGLYDMNGNVSEWTRSDWSDTCPVSVETTENAHGKNTPQPDMTVEKVICGGNWMSRPVDSTSSFRWKYPVFQKIYNVGFRVMLPVDTLKP